MNWYCSNVVLSKIQESGFKTQTQHSAAAEKKKKKMRSEEAWSRAGPDSGSGERMREAESMSWEKKAEQEWEKER